MTAHVTLSIFSGRPDPTWTLTDMQVAELAERLRRAEPLASSPDSELGENLGYRGFVVEAGDSRLPSQLAVYRGVAVPHRGDDPVALRAPDLERFLLETGRDAIPNELLAYLERELG